MTKLVTPKIKAVRPKNQKAVTGYVKAEVAYQQAVNDLSQSESDDCSKGINKANKKMETQWEKAYDWWNELPKYEQKSVSKKLKEFRGY